MATYCFWNMKEFHIISVKIFLLQCTVNNRYKTANTHGKQEQIEHLIPMRSTLQQLFGKLIWSFFSLKCNRDFRFLSISIFLGRSMQNDYVHFSNHCQSMVRTEWLFLIQWEWVQTEVAPSPSSNFPGTNQIIVNHDVREREGIYLEVHRPIQPWNSDLIERRKSKS